MPRFFSFLDPSSSTIAGCSIPRNELDIDALEQAGFRLVITLIRESPLSPSWFRREDRTPKQIQNAFVPIENRKAPAFPEVEESIPGLASPPHRRATLIHCGGGKGRAGIVLAAHLIRFGLIVVKRADCLNRYEPMMTAKDAIAHLREIRPGSIESVEQEK
ncbi:MAG: protein-tyrosine phosphatase-like protein, partial [Linnemannia elongata]